MLSVSDEVKGISPKRKSQEYYANLLIILALQTVQSRHVCIADFGAVYYVPIQ